ncbi:MAG: ABC transporter ATP-binding protein [Spirochaetales bacterium]|nr:ABC transporter ATP-binding protein [Spirochaetales bacterium]
MNIRIMDVTKTYRLGKNEVHALNGISLEIESGCFLSLAGPSGSGKTTLLNLLGCIDSPTSGDIYFEDQNICLLKEKARGHIRKNTIGFIFQSFNLIETLNVYENVEYPSVGSRKDGKIMKEKIEHLLKEIGLIDQRKRFPNTLSGGQRQRVAIARAFVNDPGIILADEPTANLDSATGGRIIELMKKMNEEKCTSLIFSTHDPYIMEMAGKVIEIHDGKIKETRIV